MSKIKVVSVTVATNGSGAASVETPDVISGEILKIVYDKGTVNAGKEAGEIRLNISLGGRNARNPAKLFFSIIK